ncbi:MAG: NDP-sugar synthase [Spirochaetes bacterium]|nr:NDP-sugar synthase [Spirochaetota bacterium]
MKAFLLAAGFGERLRPLTESMPKPLAPVMNVPALCYALTLLKEAGVTEVVCNLHHLRECIRDFFRAHNNFGIDLVFSVEETILGTGGGLMKCRALLDDGPFFYINSDIIADIDLASLARDHDRTGARGTMVVAPCAEGGGRVAVRDGAVVNLRSLLAREETPRHDFVGAAVFDPEIFDRLSSGVSDIVETGLISIAREGALAAFEYGGPWYDIGTPESYRRANIDLAEGGMALLERIHGATGFKPGAVSSRAAIGEGVRIIRSVIGEGCRVGKGALVEESVLLPGSSVGPGERAVQCILLP